MKSVARPVDDAESRNWRKRCEKRKFPSFLFLFFKKKNIFLRVIKTQTKFEKIKLIITGSEAGIKCKRDLTFCPRNDFPGRIKRKRKEV